jgi:hypothetical protein
MLSRARVMYSHALLAHFSHFIVHFHVSSRIIAFHRLLSRSAYPCPTTSLVRHIPCLVVVTSIAALLYVIMYYQRVFFLSLPRLTQFCLVYSLMIALLLSPITPLYCTSLTIGFYFEVVVTIRMHFVLPMVIVIGLD